MTHHTRRSRRAGGRPRVRGLAAILGMLVLALAFAACGSDDSSSTASSSSSGASSDAGAGVAEAQKRLEPYKAAPTKITLTEPLKSKPPSGKTVVMLGTNDPNNQKLQKGLKELAALAGWNYSTVAYDPANPATLNPRSTPRSRRTPTTSPRPASRSRRP